MSLISDTAADLMEVTLATMRGEERETLVEVKILTDFRKAILQEAREKALRGFHACPVWVRIIINSAFDKLEEEKP